MNSNMLIRVATVLLLLTVTYHETLALPVSQNRIYVTEGESFNFSCGPSNDLLEGISITLNNNEPPQGIVTAMGTLSDGAVLYQYRNTTFEDDNTRIVCTAGQDEGVIYLTVFYGPIINANTNNFTIKEGTRFSIPLSINANPQPDTFVLLFQNVSVSNVYTNSTTIEFSNILRNQTGEYSLKIFNNISTTFYNFTIDVTYPPTFINPDLPSQCYPVGSNVTYNCSTVSVVEGNPLPSLTANITQSLALVDSFELSVDTVTITNGKMDYSVNVTCIADNGVSPIATASGFVHFGSVPGPIENIQIESGFKAVTITWDAQTDTGCSQLTKYQVKVFQSDNNELISSINTTKTSYIVKNLYENSQYLISLYAVNELGISSSVNTTVWTKALEIRITALDVRRVDSNSVEVTWEFTSAGVANFTVTIRYQRLVDGMPQGNTSRSVGADDRMILLDLEDSSRYRITLYVVANEANISDTEMTEINTVTPSSAAVISAAKVLMTLLVLVIALLLL